MSRSCSRGGDARHARAKEAAAARRAPAADDRRHAPAAAAESVTARHTRAAGAAIAHRARAAEAAPHAAEAAPHAALALKDDRSSIGRQPAAASRAADRTSGPCRHRGVAPRRRAREATADAPRVLARRWIRVAGRAAWAREHATRRGYGTQFLRNCTVEIFARVFLTRLRKHSRARTARGRGPLV